jgi:hypothetical protein
MPPLNQYDPPFRRGRIRKETWTTRKRSVYSQQGCFNPKRVGEAGGRPRPPPVSVLAQRVPGIYKGLNTCLKKPWSLNPVSNAYMKIPATVRVTGLKVWKPVVSTVQPVSAFKF